MKSCFVCPIYMKERDYNYALELYNSKLKYNIEAPIFFVFSLESHMESFKQLFMEKFNKEYTEGIVVPEEGLKYKCQVTLKKFYGVKRLQSHFKYIAVIDCECLFIKHVNVDEQFKEIWNTKSFMTCNKSYLLQHLLKRCVKKLNLVNEKKIKKESENFLYNAWFNEIPVYNSEYTGAFFEWLGSKKYEDILNDNYLVDYYVFLLYLMERERFKIKKINYWAPLGIMEDIRYTNKSNGELIEGLIGTHWSSNPKTQNKKVFLLFHRDHITTDAAFKDFVSYSKYKYFIFKYTPNITCLREVFEKLADKIWTSAYYKKYRW